MSLYVPSPTLRSQSDVEAVLLKKVDHAVHAILKVVDCLLVGVLVLVKGLCLPLGIHLDNLLGCTLGSKPILFQ